MFAVSAIKNNVTKGGGTALRAFTFDRNGEERTLWETEIQYTPARFLVSLDGDVVAIDEHAHFGWEHSVVVFDRNGHVVADLSLDRILTNSEIKRHVQSTVSSRLWAWQCRFQFDDNTLVMNFDWGKKVRIDLRAGTIASK